MGAFLAKQPSGTTGSKTVNWCGSFNDSRGLRQKLGAPEGFASCALVGSSGILTRERLGERIDSAELVMRFNLAKLQGFEPIVGKRTSLRELNSESIGFILTEHHDDILAGGETLRRFRNASWCPSYPVFLNSHNAMHQNAFRAVCSEVTTIIDATVFDEHNAVLESLGPLGYNLMSGQLGLALATMLCPTGVDVYGFTHDGSTKITQHRRMPYHYYDPNATLNPLDSLSASAHLLSVFGAASQHGFISTHATRRLLASPNFLPLLLTKSTAGGAGASKLCAAVDAVRVRALAAIQRERVARKHGRYIYRPDSQ